MSSIVYSLHPASFKWVRFLCLITCWFGPLSIVDSSSAAPPTVPHGVFNLVKAGGKINVNTLNNPAVDGISLRQSWSAVNPADGVFDWSYLDNQVYIAAASGKSILIRICDGGDNIPTWVTSGATTTFSYLDTNRYHSTYNTYLTIPVFWDAFYLTKKTALIAAFGAHFTGNPAIKVACVGIANAHSDDWNVPHGVPDISNWQAVGYTSQKLIDSCETIVDAMMNAFPNQVVVIATNPNGKLDASPDYVRSAVVSDGRAKWSNRLVVAQNNLSAKTSPAPPPSGSFWSFWYNSRPAVAAQMLWFSYGDKNYRNNGGTPCDPATSLRSSIDTGVSYGTNYIEIYQTDIINLPTVISYAHSVLNPPSS
jgi:Beta-galactosidase